MQRRGFLKALAVTCLVLGCDGSAPVEEPLTDTFRLRPGDMETTWALPDEVSLKYRFIDSGVLVDQARFSSRPDVIYSSDGRFAQRIPTTLNPTTDEFEIFIKGHEGKYDASAINYGEPDFEWPVFTCAKDGKLGDCSELMPECVVIGLAYVFCDLDRESD